MATFKPISSRVVHEPYYKGGVIVIFVLIDTTAIWRGNKRSEYKVLRMAVLLIRVLSYFISNYLHIHEKCISLFNASDPYIIMQYSFHNYTCVSTANPVSKSQTSLNKDQFTNLHKPNERADLIYIFIYIDEVQFYCKMIYLVKDV